MKPTNIALTFMLLLTFTLALSAQGAFSLLTGQNHPELHWRVYDSDNFRIIYSDGLSETAEKVADLAEEIYAIHRQNLGLSFKKRYSIFISDCDDIANGGTSPFGYIFLWIKPSDYIAQFTGNASWLTKVIAHEMVHALVFANSSSWIDLVCPAATLNAFYYIDFYEGIAQFYADEKWGLERGDRYLNLAIRDDNLFTTDSDIDFGGLTYGMGFAKVKWLRQQLSDQDIGRIFRKKRPLGIFAFAHSFRKVVGQSYNDFVGDWQKDMNVYYNWREAVAEPTATIGTKIADIPLKQIWVIRRSPAAGKIYALTAVDSSETHSRKLWTYEPQRKKRRLLAENSIAANFSFSADGRRIAFSRRRFGRFASVVSDIYEIDLGSGKEVRISSDLRAFDPVYAANGDILFLGNEGETVNIYCWQRDDKKCRPVSAFTGEYQLADLAISPDRQRLAAIFIAPARKQGGVLIYNLEQHTTKEFATASIGRYPLFSPANSDELLYTDTENDVSNAWLLNLHSGEKSALTNQANFVLLTDWPEANRAIGARQTQRSGNEAFALDVSRKPASFPGTLQPKYRKWHDTAPALPMTISGKKSAGRQRGKFHPLANLRPLLIIPTPFYLRERLAPGVSVVAADMLGKHQLAAMVAFDTKDWQRPDFQFIYSNRTTRWNIQAGIARQNVSTFHLRGKTPLYERLLTLYLGLSRSFNAEKTFAHSTVSLGCSWEQSNILNAEEFPPQDNNDQPIESPQAYRIGALTFSWQKTVVQPYVRFPFSGHGLHLRYDWQPTFLGSDHQVHYFQLGGYTLFPLGAGLQFYLTGDLQIVEGTEVLQNRLGMTKYATFYLYNKYSEESYVRGNTNYFPGERLFTLSWELRSPLYSGLLNLALFADLAMLWDGGLKELEQAKTLISAGAEMQIYVDRTITLALGTAHLIQPAAAVKGKWRWYLNLKKLLPF